MCNAVHVHIASEHLACSKLFGFLGMLRFIATPLYLYVGCMINEITYHQYHLIEFVKAFPDPLNLIRCPVNRRSLPNPLSPVNRPLWRQPLFEAVDTSSKIFALAISKGIPSGLAAGFRADF